MSRAFVAPTECPVCGESVPHGARACPGCGADERSGWDEAASRYDGLDLPDSAFSEETEQAVRRQHARGLWLVAGLGLLVLALLGLIFR